MNKIRASLSLALASLLIVSCASIGPGFTLPPIVIPSFSIPTFPPIVLPSGLPDFSFPPIEFPSADANSGACPLITAAEVAGIMGSAASITSSDSDSCTYTFSNFSTIVVTKSSGTDIATSKFLFGDTAKDLVVNNLPAVSGVFIGQPAVHVQRGTDQLQIQGVLTGSDDATIAKLVQIAQIAASRW
jgi:hypothetical protein